MRAHDTVRIGSPSTQTAPQASERGSPQPLAKMRTSTGLLEAEPSTLPEQEAGCLTQVAATRFTHRPLDTVTLPDAPPLSRRLVPPTQRSDQRKLSGVLAGSVTTSRNERAGWTSAKLVASVADGGALCRTTRAPYVPASAGAASRRTDARHATTVATKRVRIAKDTALRLEESRKMRIFG
jgi:hypothetical protein